MKTIYKEQDYYDWYDSYKKNKLSDMLINMPSKKQRTKTDEEILEEMDIKTIENFLRKKKLSNINK